MRRALPPAETSRDPAPGRDLLAGLGRADPAAFGCFYDAYLSRVHAWCLVRTGDPAKAEAWTETILCEALRTLDTGDGAAPLAVQVLRVARRVAQAR